MKTKKLGYHENDCPNHWNIKSWNKHIIGRINHLEEVMDMTNDELEEQNPNFLRVYINELMKGCLQGTEVEQIYRENYHGSPGSSYNFSNLKDIYHEICILLEIESCFNVLVDCINEDESSKMYESGVYDLDIDEFLDYVVTGGELELYFLEKGYSGVSSHRFFWDLGTLLDELKTLKD
jgi:hypothetical protein